MSKCLFVRTYFGVNGLGHGAGLELESVCSVWLQLCDGGVVQVLSNRGWCGRSTPFGIDSDCIYFLVSLPVLDGSKKLTRT